MGHVWLMINLCLLAVCGSNKSVELRATLTFCSFLQGCKVFCEGCSVSLMFYPTAIGIWVFIYGIIECAAENHAYFHGLQSESAKVYWPLGCSGDSLEENRRLRQFTTERTKKVCNWLEIFDLTEPTINSLEIMSMLSLKSKAENVITVVAVE